MLVSILLTVRKSMEGRHKEPGLINRRVDENNNSIFSEWNTL
jgi:hypothetical protein